MNKGALLIVGLILLLVGIYVGRTYLPTGPKVLAAKPVYQTIVIKARGAGGEVEDITASRGRGDYVRWSNCTNVDFHIVFTSVAQGGKGDPLDRDGIDVPAGGASTYARVIRLQGNSGAVYHTYTSTTHPLVKSGGPDAPGMTVDE